MQRRSTLVPLLALACLASAPAYAQWSTTSLSLARANAAAVTVGDFTLFAGGNSGTTISNRVDIYNSSLGLPNNPAAWSSASTLTNARTTVGATAVGNLALFAGGWQAPGTLNDVDWFDATTQGWSFTPALSQARGGIAATTVGNLAIFAGGEGPGGVVATVDIYDASAGLPSNSAAWSLGNPLSQARAGATAVTLGNLAIFAGGSGPQGLPYDTVDIYDSSLGLPNNPAAWSVHTLSIARLMGPGAAAVVGTRVFFGGGHNSLMGGSTMYDTVDIYDSTLGPPTSAAAWMVTLMPAGPRGYVGVTAVANMVLFAGGAKTGFVDTDLVEVLDAGSLQWLPAINPPMALSVARHGPRAVTIGDKAIFAGVGGGGGLPSDVVDIFDPSSGRQYCTAKTNSQACVPAIGASGIASASSGSGFLVSGTNFINNKNCLLFYGLSGQASIPFQGGTLCVKSPIKRTPGTNTGGNPPPNDCSGAPSIDMNLFAAGGLGGTPLPALQVYGTIVDCQWWGRDPGFAAPNNTQMSDGLEYTVWP